MLVNREKTLVQVFVYVARRLTIHTTKKIIIIKKRMFVEFVVLIPNRTKNTEKNIYKIKFYSLHFS